MSLKIVKFAFVSISAKIAHVCQSVFFKKMGQSRPLFKFRSFFITISIQIEKSIDGVLGI